MGEGGFSTTWRAEDRETGEVVALKLARRDHPAMRARFDREARALAGIDGRGAPRLVARGEVEGRAFLAMQLVGGETLALRMARRAKLDVREGIEDALRLLDALALVHDAGFAHGDLKAENVLDGDGGVTLVDFGQARVLADGGGDRDLAGTLETIAPERLRGAPADVPSDLYAFGVVAFELVAGRPPFVGTATELETAHLGWRPPRATNFAPVAPGIDEALARCLAKDPASRPASARAVRELLVASANQPAVVARGAHRVDAPSASARRTAVVLVVEAEPIAPAAARIGAHGGIVARQRGRRLVAAFLGEASSDPSRDAMRVAQVLVADGARVAMHVAPIVARTRGAATPTLIGSAIDAPETWLPHDPWAGLVTTAEASRWVDAPAAKDQHALHATLRGRDDVLARLRDTATRALGGGAVTLVTLVGETGYGKTRILDEVRFEITRAWPDALVVVPRAQAGASDLLRAVGARDDDAITAPAPAAAERGEIAQRVCDRVRSFAIDRGLAILLDDAHLADDVVLDALELGTLDAEGARLLVVCAADPSLDRGRASFGARSARHERIEIGPLDAEASRALAADLLAPAEYPSEGLLDELAAWSGRQPGCLVELARALHAGGYVRPRPDGRSSYLAGADLAGLPRVPAWSWVGARLLASLPQDVAASAILCAILGLDVEKLELAALLDALERDGASPTPLDPGVALAALAARDVLVRVSTEDALRERFAFRNASIREALYDNADVDLRRRAQRHALDWSRAAVERDADERTFAALARHAAAVGAHTEAGGAALRLGDRARARHCHAEADARYSSAIASFEAAGANVERAVALVGRASSRYRIARARDAVADLDEAHRLAIELGDDRLRATILLERATALDWVGDHPASAESASAAQPLVERIGDAALAVELDVALGRSRWRHAAVEEAIELLARGADRGREIGAHEARVVALLLLSCALVQVGRLQDAEGRFDEVIEVCSASADRVHLCTAYGNRAVLRCVQQDVARGIDDLARAAELARQAGNPWPERNAMVNTAELLFFSNRDDEALPYVRRSRWLEERFGEQPTFESALLLARIQLARREVSEARGFADWVERTCAPPAAVSPNGAAQLWAVLAVLSAGQDPTCASAVAWAGHEGPAAWQEVFDSSAAWLPDERLELLYWQARWGLELQRKDVVSSALAKAATLDGELPSWQARFAALARACG